MNEATEQRRSVEGRVEIRATPERVWRALTDAAELERWFPLEARVEPGPGGSIWMSWKNEYAGESKIVAWDPPRHLRVTWGGSDEAGAAQVTDYFIDVADGHVVLRVVTSGFPADASWDDWVEGTRMGWAYELQSLKQYLERHDGRDRDVVYLRRRVHLPVGTIWDRLFGQHGLPSSLMEGEVIGETPHRQRVLRLEEPSQALLRVSTDPSMGGDGRDVTVWLSAWDGDAAGLAPVRVEWEAQLERLFPEGEAV
jgi:uncharacterized protein YndB with AHSA1/START domain